MIRELKARFRWWHAKRFGDRPECERCDMDADFYLSATGYLCGMCYMKGQPWQSPGFMRDLEPSDYYE